MLNITIFYRTEEYIRSGAIGEVVNIQHMEPIEFAHMAHSYVRGKWRVEETTPLFSPNRVTTSISCVG